MMESSGGKEKSSSRLLVLSPIDVKDELDEVNMCYISVTI